MAEGKRDLLVVAVQKHKPKEEDDLGSEQAMNTSPGVAAQLSVEIGEKFEVLGRDVDCWLYEKHVGSGEEGYIPSTCVDLTQEDEDKIAKGAENLVLDALVEAENRKPCPEDSANIFSRLGFMWLTSLIFKGFKKPLTDADLWALNKTKRSSTVVPPFVKKWKEAESSISVSGSFQITEPTDNEKAELKPDDAEEDVKFSFEGKKKEKRPSLSRIMFEIYWDKLLLAVFLKLLNDCFEFVQPQLLRLLIDFIEDRDNTETWRGYTYGVSMLVVALVKSTCLQQYFHVVTVLGMEIRTAVIGMVYSKALSLNNSSRKISTSGEIVNLMSVDAQQLMDLLTYVNILWSGPLQIIVSLSFLYSTMGPSILAGVGVLLLLIPFNILVSRLSRKYQLELMVAKDKRIKMMNEILNGIKILKLYAWETPFMEMVSRIRETELRHLMKLFCLDASFIFTSSCAPFLVSLATFAIYVMTGNELTASKAFFAISLLNILRFPLVMFPNVIISLSKARVSIARLTEFLFLEELDSENVAKNMPEHISTQDIHVENGSFSWDKNSEPALQEINISIPSGSLVAVVGQVGCGKSTLISALLGETEKLDGRVYLKGSVAYVPQQAWIQNATLRDNILFGRTFESKRYAETIYTCALQSDIEILLGGDLTEIGERGINLSGGQKQRVSLARAVYFNADIYLLDDPLSAVDSRVGKHIFDEVIGPRGKLRMKTRILVTHGIAFLPQVDQIIVLQDGRISELGTYTELIEKKGAFAEFLKRYAIKEQAKLEYAEEPSSEIVKEESAKVDGQFSSRLSLERLDSHPDVQRLKRAESMSEQTDRMIEEEKSQTGRVKLKVFWAYAKSLTVPLSIWVLLALIFAEANSVIMEISLARWSSTEVTSDDERNRFLGIYSFLGVSKCLIVAMQPLVLAMGTIKASRHFHQRMLENILHSPMSFFETTSEGRIVNRFSKDISSIDDIVPKTVSSFLRTFLAVIASIFTICFATPIVLVIVVPLGVLYIFIQRIFVASSRELKRIESVSRSPIYNNFLETINGTSTIRAFAQQQRFIQGNYVIVDENQVSCYPLISSNRWLAVRLELIGILITFFAAVFAVLRRNSLQSGLVGLSVTYALQVTQTLYWLVRMSSDLETNIVSVERVKEYSETPTEAKWIIPDNRPPEDWPQAGNIVIKEFDLKYREGLPLVLMQIDCDIKPGERVGIVGRTGKSALTLALFRILERAGGRIVIDGVDIAKIGLQDLRSRLAIIPQDPVLFSGTLRFNLDPFDSHTDKELWKILEMSHLKNFVSGLEKGLLHPVTEGGENLSVGQRQLVCLARALLRESKILVLDETTAAVDLETDEFIQHMIRREFADRTVFTIAHRLNTIMDYTRIMVLDKGFLVEFDTPRALLAQKGIFYKMARDAGLARVTR